MQHLIINPNILSTRAVCLSLFCEHCVRMYLSIYIYIRYRYICIEYDIHMDLKWPAELEPQTSSTYISSRFPGPGRVSLLPVTNRSRGRNCRLQHFSQERVQKTHSVYIIIYPIGSMYAIYGNIYHLYTYIYIPMLVYIPYMDPMGIYMHKKPVFRFRLCRLQNTKKGSAHIYEILCEHVLWDPGLNMFEHPWLSLACNIHGSVGYMNIYE